jgi:hypothetical protein
VSLSKNYSVPIIKVCFTIAVEDPRLVLIIGSIGLSLNILSATLLHEHHSHYDEGHDHSHSRSDHARLHAAQGVDQTSINMEAAVSPSGSPDENIPVTVSIRTHHPYITILTNMSHSPVATTRNTDTPSSICGGRGVILECWAYSCMLLQMQ